MGTDRISSTDSLVMPCLFVLPSSLRVSAMLVVWSLLFVWGASGIARSSIGRCFQWCDTLESCFSGLSNNRCIGVCLVDQRDQAADRTNFVLLWTKPTFCVRFVGVVSAVSSVCDRALLVYVELWLDHESTLDHRYWTVLQVWIVTGHAYQTPVTWMTFGKEEDKGNIADCALFVWPFGSVLIPW